MDKCKISFTCSKFMDINQLSIISTPKSTLYLCSESMRAITSSWLPHDWKPRQPPSLIVQTTSNKTAKLYLHASKKLNLSTNILTEIMTMKLQARMHLDCQPSTRLATLSTYPLVTRKGRLMSRWQCGHCIWKKQASSSRKAKNLQKSLCQIQFKTPSQCNQRKTSNKRKPKFRKSWPMWSIVQLTQRISRMLRCPK